MGLEKTGLQLVIQGTQSFISDVQRAQKATDRLHESFQRLTSRSASTGLKSLNIGEIVPSAALDRLKGLNDQFDQLGMIVSRVSPQIGGAIHLFSGLAAELGRTASAMSLTTMGAVALGAALIGLGMRGAAMTGVVQAFDALTASAGTTANVLLQDLREAARGTIADMELMRQANVALAGAGPELAKALATDGGLAGLLEIARVQARATGESVDYLFQSLVSGIKRSSPRLIDNTGLVLQVGEANEAYARALGKTVEQLTAEEQQIALLNATLEAGRVGIEQYGNTALQASEYMARIQTTITNTLDRLALAVQPIFTTLLAIADTIVSGIVWPIQNIVIPILYELANTIFGPLLTSFNLFRDAVGEIMAPVLNLIHRWVVVVVGTLRYLGHAFQWIAEQAAKLFAPIKDIVKKYIVEPFTKLLDPVNFARAAGRTFGAYAEGIMWVANNLIFPAVIAIAKFIADFLMGFSPPKKGPLSTIDKGAAAVMRAWLEGFTGVSLSPVSDMMGRVNTLLGDIALLTHDKVTALLAQLDEELQPFIDNLEIAKAYAESILGPLQQAEDAMRKRLDAAVQQFTKGGLSADAVRALDRQNEALAKQKELWEGVTAEAEYQLALKKSEQALLRAMLMIQERRTRPDEKIAAAAEKAAKAVKEATTKGGGGEAPEPEAAVAGAGGALPDLSSSIGNILGVTDEEINELFGEMGTAFTEAFMTPGVKNQWKLFEKNTDQLQKQIDRAKQSKPFQEMQKWFGEDGELAKSFEGFKSSAELIWDGLFNSENGYMVNKWREFKKTFSPDFDAYFSESGGGSESLSDKFWKWTAAIALATDGLFGEDESGLKGKFNQFKTDVGDIWDSIFGEDGNILSTDFHAIVTKFNELFVLDGEGSLRRPVSFFKTYMSMVFTGEGPFSLSAIFKNFTGQQLLDKFNNLFVLSGVDSLRNPVNFFKTYLSMVFTGTGPFSLESIWSAVSTQTIKTKFSDDFGEGGVLQLTMYSFMETMRLLFEGDNSTFGKLMSGAAGLVENLFTLPVTTVLNALIGAFVGTLNLIAKAFNSIIDGILENQGIADPLIPDAVLEKLRMKELNPADFMLGPTQKTLGGPPTPTPGSFARGAFLGPGLARVHGGEVLVQSARPYAVFPKKWVDAMDRLANAMVPYNAPSVPAPVVNVQSSGGVTNHNTFNVHSQQSMRLALARARAFGT